MAPTTQFGTTRGTSVFTSTTGNMNYIHRDPACSTAGLEQLWVASTLGHLHMNIKESEFSIKQQTA
jgi:hypothetical protein